MNKIKLVLIFVLLSTVALMFAAPITLTFRDTSQATKTAVWAQLPTYPVPTPTDGSYSRWVIQFYKSTDNVIDPLGSNGLPTGDDVVPTNAGSTGVLNFGPTGTSTWNAPSFIALDAIAVPDPNVVYHSSSNKVYIRIFNSNSISTATKYIQGTSLYTVLSATGNVGYIPTYGWSTWVTFVLPSVPNPAILVLPADAAEGLGYSGQALTWTAGAAPAPTGYDVYFGTDNPPMTKVSSNQAGITYPTGALAQNTWHYWKIVPLIGTTPAVGCPVWSFKTRPEYNPGVATNPVPSNGGSFAAPVAFPFNQTLSWTAPAGDVSGYDVYFGTDNPPLTKVSDNQVALFYANAAITAVGTYYWIVEPYWTDPGTKSVNGKSVSPRNTNTANTRGPATGCPVWSFTVSAYVPPAPGAPTLVSPVDGALDIAVAGTMLTWHDNSTKSFLDFDVYCDTNTPPTTNVYHGAGTPNGANLEAPSLALTAGSTYYWKVKVTTGAGSSESDIWHFHTVAAPTYDIPANDPTPQPDGTTVTSTIPLNVDGTVTITDPVIVLLPNLGNLTTPVVQSYTGSGTGTLTVHVNGAGPWWGMIHCIKDAEPVAAWHFADTPSFLLQPAAGPVDFVFNNVFFGAKGEVIVLMGGGSDPTLPVELSSFTAVMTSQYFINLTWVTESESQVLGFNVYRSENSNDTNPPRLNPVLIPATNTSQQQTYTMTDTENLVTGHTYYYWLENIEMGGAINPLGSISATVTGQSTPVLPEVSVMGSAYPNPFLRSGTTTIDVDIKAGETGTVTIYNILGQTVKTFKVNQGEHRLTWNAKDCASGIYFYKLSTPSRNTTKKLVIVN